MAQNWEYKFLQGERKPIRRLDQEAGFETINEYEKELTWSEDGKPLDNSLDIFALSRNLGLQGWELTTILPRSFPASMATAGTTTEELWVFKRPNQKNS